MPCYSPITAYQAASGEIVFVERRQHDIRRTLQLPCGQCVGCRLERSRQWAVRCMHEASLHPHNAFVTLTYDDNNAPYRGMLDHRDFQLFLKRLRKHIAPARVRFYMCGEYGEQNDRPHFHACLFGWDWKDKIYWGKSPTGEKIYRSTTLESIWTKGFSSTAGVTFRSAAYVARYCVKKVTGWNAQFHYAREDAEGKYQLPPEYNKMSLKPGIGAPWLEKWQMDVYPHDYIIVNGVKVKPPKYYDKLFERTNEQVIEDIKHARETRAREKYEDNTEERLRVKEIVQKAQLNMLKRKL